MVVNYKEMLSYNLRRLGVENPEKLYKYLRKLQRLPFIGDCTLDITTRLPEIVAEYKGRIKVEGKLAMPDKKGREDQYQTKLPEMCMKYSSACLMLMVLLWTDFIHRLGMMESVMGD